MSATSTQNTPPPNQELWRTIFTVGHPKLKSYQRMYKSLPSPPRCNMCFAPFAGVGGVLMRLRGKGKNRRNPKYCDACDKFIHAFPGGAEVDLSIIFVDVRGSVNIAERMSPTDFSRVMSDFYAMATKALIDTDGFIIDTAGDHVVGVYPPGFSGAWHARKALMAAAQLLCAANRPALNDFRTPIGIGVHTGTVYIGTVAAGEAGVQDVGILGDNTNIAARLAALAQAGEALVSDAVYITAQLKVDGLEAQELQLKGKTAPTFVRVLRVKEAQDLLERADKSMELAR